MLKILFMGLLNILITRDFYFAILRRGPRVFQIGKVSVVNLFGKFVIMHNYGKTK